MTLAIVSLGTNGLTHPFLTAKQLYPRCFTFFYAVFKLT